MDTALCTDDGITYTAVDFSALPPTELACKRRALQCTECCGPAFFRKASRNGQAACFGARPHADNCALAAPEYDLEDDGTGNDQDELHNPGERIVVDFNFGVTNPPIHIEASDLPPNRNRPGRHRGAGIRPDAQTHRRPSTLLHNLIQVPAFRQSEQTVVVEGHDEIPVRDFFVPLSDVSRRHVKLYRGFWGMLSDARFDEDKTLWLNSGSRKNMSFCLRAEQVDGVYARYNVNDEEDFAGAYILVFGTLLESQNGKLYCVIEDPGFVAMRLAP